MRRRDEGEERERGGGEAQGTHLAGEEGGQLGVALDDGHPWRCGVRLEGRRDPKHLVVNGRKREWTGCRSLESGVDRGLDRCLIRG